MKAKFHIILLLLLLPPLCFARYFRVMHVSDGLPNNNVKCIAQDNNGFIWLGTFDGLCRFDGNEFTVFNHTPGDSLSLAGNHISSLLAAPGGMWVGSNGGFSFFSFHDSRFHLARQLLPTGEHIGITRHIVTITTCGEHIFALSSSGQLYRHCEGLLWEQCEHHPEIRWYSIAAYKNGTLLTYAPDGIYLLDADGKSILSKLHCKITGNGIIYYSRNLDMIFIGYGLGYASDVFRIDKDQHLEKVNIPVPANVKSIIDYRNETVFATDGNGLCYRHADSTEVVTPQNSNISSDAVYSLFADKDSNLWVGTYRGGVNLYADNYNWFSSLTLENKQLTHNMVTAIQSRESKLYIGLDGGGLNVYDRRAGTTVAYTAANSGLPGNNVLSLSQDNNHIWMGIYGKGLCRFSPGQGGVFKTYQLPFIRQSLNQNEVTKIQDVGNGNIWIFGHEPYVFDTAKEEFRLLTPLRGVAVSHVARQGDVIWVSSTNKGLLKMDRNTCEILAHYHTDSPDKTIDSNRIQSVFVDSQHNIWFVADPFGLYRLDEKTGLITFFDTKKGPVPLQIAGISEADDNLWISTYNGLFRFDMHTGTFARFGKKDNMPSAHFNSQACYKEGEMLYFGTTGGLVYFNPDHISRWDQFKPVYFTGFELISNDKKTIDLYSDAPEDIRLPYNQNFFTIRFSVPELISPEKVEFSCRMSNFEGDWRELGTDRHVTFTNIPPGKYVFYVRASDGEGRWNNQPSVLRIIIGKPWWKTNWAMALWMIIALVTLFLVLTFYRRNLNNKHMVQLKEMEKNTAKSISEAKLNFYTNITHELRTPIFLITAPLEELLAGAKGPVQVPKSSIAALYRNAMRLNKLISRILDFRKLESGKLRLEKQRLNVVAFCKELTIDYEALCFQKDIIFYFQPCRTVIRLDFDPEKLESILSNLISNAFKYTPEGGKVVFSIDETEDSVVFTIEDNGIGINKEYHEAIFDSFFQVDASQASATGDGVGLSFVKYLVDLHGGRIKIESEPEKGSRFIFNIPQTAIEEEELMPVELPKVVVDNSLPHRQEMVVTVQSPTNTRTILIIDDERETLEVIEKFLIGDFHILKAVNGADGLLLAQQELPDIVICDMMMPKMTGTEFLAQLKGDKKTVHILVIMFTAKSSEEDKIAAFDLGAHAYLTKPISLKYLRKRIDHLLLQQEASETTNPFSFISKAYTKEEQRFLLQCREVIDDNLLNTEFNIVLFAEKLGMSHSAAYKRIKQITGLSIIDFIAEYKVFKAVQYFNEGETNIGSVVARCGFKDIKSFREVFKRKMGVTPKRYVQEKV